MMLILYEAQFIKKLSNTEAKLKKVLLIKKDVSEGELGLINSSQISLKFVSATFLLVCFLILKESTCKTRKNIFILLQNLFLFSRKIKF